MTHWHVYTPVWDALDLRLATAPDRYQIVRTPDLAPRAWRSRSPAHTWAGRRRGPDAAAIVRQCDLPDCAPQVAPSDTTAAAAELVQSSKSAAR